jgi:hypothetical protein
MNATMNAMISVVSQLINRVWAICVYVQAVFYTPEERPNSELLVMRSNVVGSPLWLQLQECQEHWRRHSATLAPTFSMDEKALREFEESWARHSADRVFLEPNEALLKWYQGQ